MIIVKDNVKKYLSELNVKIFKIANLKDNYGFKKNKT